MTEIPLVPGEVVGWRAWGVVITGRREPGLRSLFEGGKPIWPTRDWFHARCPISWPCAESPGPDCSCGVYAARDRHQLVGLHAYGDPRQAPYTRAGGPITAIGQVALAGLVIPGSRGWRAARARVLRIWLPYAHWDIVESLARAYRVPVGLSNVLINTEGSHGGHRS